MTTKKLSKKTTAEFLKLLSDVNASVIIAEAVAFGLDNHKDAIESGLDDNEIGPIEIQKVCEDFITLCRYGKTTQQWLKQNKVKKAFT
jgi:hypothetical protein